MTDNRNNSNSNSHNNSSNGNISTNTSTSINNTTNDNRIWLYIAWISFYVILFGIFTFFLIIPFYIISFLILLSPLAEKLWRVIMGVRPLRLNQEKERLLPLFEEVYTKAKKKPRKNAKEIYNPLPSNINIKLYIQESMDINAFAFGRSTLVLTKGSTLLLNDDNLKGLIAHELGHFANRDTFYALCASIANLPMSLSLRLLSIARTKMEESGKSSLAVRVVRGFIDMFYYGFKGVEFVGDLIIMHSRRRSEYEADLYAHKLKYGAELAEVLTQIYQISMEKPKSVGEMVRASHPHLTKRVERLEGVV